MTTLTLPPLPGLRSSFRAAVASYWLDALRFDGRASRSTYWWAQLHIFVIVFVISLIGGVLGVLPIGAFIDNLISPVFAILTIVPQFALLVRRLHDTNRSGWWALLQLVPVVNLVVFVWTLLPGTRGPNRFDNTAPVRRKFDAPRRILFGIGAFLAGELLVFIALEFAFLDVLLGATLNSNIPDAVSADVLSPTRTAAPGVFAVMANNGTDPSAGLATNVNPVGWQIAAVIIALLLGLWRAAIHRHEQRLAVRDA